MNMTYWCHIFQKIIYRAKKVKLSQYESPEFYDSFSRAMDEALEQGMGGLLNICDNSAGKCYDAQCRRRR